MRSPREHNQIKRISLNMKVIRCSLLTALTVAAILASTPELRAQETKETPKEAPKREGRPGGADFAKVRAEQLAKELSLKDDQKTKVEELFKAQGEKMRELRSATPEERREKGKTMREEMDKKMKEILTAEQYAKWEKNRAQGRGPGGPGVPRGEKKKEKAD